MKSNMIRIFTKVAFLFKAPEQGMDDIRTKALTFNSVPEWVQNDLQFKRGLAAGEIEVIQNREQALSAELVAADGLEKMIKKDAAEKAVADEKAAKEKAEAEARAAEEAEKPKRTRAKKKPEDNPGQEE